MELRWSLPAADDYGWRYSTGGYNPPMTKMDGSEDERLATFDRQKSVMQMYSDNAKTYIQLSGAALGADSDV